MVNENERAEADLVAAARSGDEEALAAEHLATCEECTAELNELEGITKLYREHGTMHLPDDARKRIAESLGITD